MSLDGELKEILGKHGAGLVGTADMEGVENCGYRYGVAAAVPLPAKVVRDLQNAPTKEYYDLYYSINEKLNEIVLAGEAFLKERGYEAYAQTTERVTTDDDSRSKVPHKTVAARAGLGWIGKNCLLVTTAYGSAVRLSSLLTNAPLQPGTPVTESKCGACTACVNSCPAQALKGTLWTAGTERKAIVDVEKCYRKQKEIMLENTGIETDLCGRCFAVCTYTQKYLRQARQDGQIN